MNDEYRVPKHIVAVSALVRNGQGEVLLVKTHGRSDTWELPGGQVEEGEPPHLAVCRELKEETGIEAKANGVTGVYYNATMGILSMVFTCEYLGGEVIIQPEEIKEAQFVQLDESNIDEYISRPHMKSRTLDALHNKGVIPYEAWEMKPFELLSRLDDSQH
ncbi:DNA mismatch repair protein MutT [Paenibacillus selenitireducens]|uniref:DNA mismatch repair protein MutT n=1 Tax=Paenibacillus selenitireducens TaxID=1324314 RepID=A0A1T2X5T1_9BACL|nr:NUDIX hydrolase [Paenibacillus selenitireducens]OPA75212.1 DNA mismatch repair protein MutT [Paenibacillus selenitireducens]